MGKIIDNFRGFLELQEYSEITIKIYLNYIQKFLKYLEGFADISGNPDFSGIKLSDITDYIKTEGLTKSQVFNFFKAIKLFFKFLQQEGLIKENPIKFSIQYHTSNKKEILTDEEIRKMLSICENVFSTRDYLILLLFCETGARINEITNIEIKNIDLKNNSIYLTRTKYNRPRYIFFSNKTKEVMLKWLKDRKSEDGRLFDIGKQAIYYIVKKAVQVAFPGKRNISPHSLRHSFITSFVRNNGNVSVLKNIVGWTSLKQLETYEHLNKEMLKEEYNKFLKKKKF